METILLAELNKEMEQKKYLLYHLTYIKIDTRTEQTPGCLMNVLGKKAFIHTLGKLVCQSALAV